MSGTMPLQLLRYCQHNFGDIEEVEKETEAKDEKKKKKKK